MNLLQGVSFHEKYADIKINEEEQAQWVVLFNLIFAQIKIYFDIWYIYYHDK